MYNNIDIVTGMLMISLEKLVYEKRSHADITNQAYFSALIQNSYVYSADQNNSLSSILPSLLWSIDNNTVWRFLALMRKCSVSFSRSNWESCYITGIVKSRCGYKSKFQQGCYKSWCHAPSAGMWVILFIVIYNSYL